MRASLVWRFLGRTAVAVVALAIFSLVGVQFTRVIHQNVALAGELAQTQNEVSELQDVRARQARQLRRLEDPEGAIPEIHDRLRLVRPNEAIVFVSPLPSAAPSSNP
jgi:cell division protein FtsB